MEFADKNKAYKKLKGRAHYDGDRKLLEIRKPGAPILKQPVNKRNVAHIGEMILFELLSVAKPFEIEAFRESYNDVPIEQKGAPKAKNKEVPAEIESPEIPLASDVKPTSQKKSARPKKRSQKSNGATPKTNKSE